MLDESINRSNNWFEPSRTIFLADHHFYRTALLPISYWPLASTNFGNDSFFQALENSRIYSTIDFNLSINSNDILDESHLNNSVNFTWNDSESCYDLDDQLDFNVQDEDPESIKYLNDDQLNYINQQSNPDEIIIIQSIKLADQGLDFDGQEEVIEIKSTKCDFEDRANEIVTEIELSIGEVPVPATQDEVIAGGIEISITPAPFAQRAPRRKRRKLGGAMRSNNEVIITTPEIEPQGLQISSTPPLILNSNQYQLTSQIVLGNQDFEGENKVDGDNDLPSNNPCRKIINFCSKIFQCFGRQ